MIKNSLYTKAFEYLCERQWSIIPLQGTGSDGKRPLHSIKWSKYCQRHANLAELRAWFAQNDISAIGIICGMISGLIVIEFDSTRAYQQFAARYPHLLKTFTVTSGGRGLPHLYYRVDYPVRNREGSWGSLRSDGRYVVAAPSTINGKTYMITNDVEVRYLSLDELQHISGFLSSEKTTTTQTTQRSGHPTVVQSTEHEIINQYQREAPAIGRNNALYRAALHAHSTGIGMMRCVELLTEQHVKTQSFWEHAHESEHQRRHEAAHTITSAYSTNRFLPAQHLNIKRITGTGIANQLREKLLAEDRSSITARLMDALKKRHVLDSRKELTSIEIIEIGRSEGLAHHSVRKVLNGKLGVINGIRLIEEITHSHKEQKPVRYGDNRVTNIQNTGGRPPQRYRVADLFQVYEKLDIEEQHSDPLGDDALKSDTAYRQALHRALLKRRPAQYAIGWLARRIGRSVRTIQRYNNALNVQRTPVYARSSLKWDTFTEALFYPQKRRQNGITPGYWLQASDGERYPSIRGLAAKLMAAGKQLFTCWRLPNHYRIDPENAVTDTPNPIWRTVEHTSPRTGEQQPIMMGKSQHQPDLSLQKEMNQAGPSVVIPHTGRQFKLPEHDTKGRKLYWNPFKLGQDNYPVFHQQYAKITLEWSNIDRVLPPDDINEEINESPQWWKQASIVVKDFYGSGMPKRFPVMRGLARKLLKQFGEQNVIYVQRVHEWALRAQYDEGLYALECGHIDDGIHHLRKLGMVTYQ